MANAPTHPVLRHLRRLVGPPAPDEASDGQLLDRFVARRDEAAFAALLRRHGAMVLHVCRRVLGRLHDAEDAFQATFLLLARNARSIRRREAVASWLYGVAYRLAVRARLQEGRRKLRERRVTAGPVRDAAWQVAWSELQAVLDDELGRLPEKYRAPLVLCYLEGKTHEQAARRLGWPLGTVRGRVARARDLLRRRLTRRGLALTAPTFAAALAANVAPGAVPAGLCEPTLRAALTYAGGRAAAGLVSAQAAALADGGVPTMFLTKLKLLAAAVLAVGVLASGVGALTPRGDPPARAAAAQADDPPRRADLPQAQARAADQEPARADRLGDALPPGARARLGSDRLSQIGTYYTLAFAPDGKTLAYAQMDSTIRLVEVPAGKEVGRLGEKKPPDTGRRNYWVSHMAFSADGKLLAALKPDGKVTVWDLAAGRAVCRLDVDLQYEVASVAFSPDGKTLATGGKRQPVRLWEVATGNELRRFTGHQGAAPCVAFAPDGKGLATGGEDQTVRLWEVETGKEIRQLKGHRNGVQAVGFAPDGKAVASAGTDATVRLWDAATGQEVRRLDCSRGYNNPLATTGVIIFVSFSADGKTVALGRSDRSVRFWDAATGRELPRFEGQAGEATNLALSPDARVVAMGNVGGKVHLWDRLTGQDVTPGEGHHNTVHAAAFSPDGTLLATGSADRTIRLWDAATGREVRRLEGHSGAVHNLCFAPDGKTLASASRDPNDRTVSLWDVAAGKEVAQFLARQVAVPDEGRAGRSAAAQWLAFAPDGKTLALLDGGGVLWLWDAATGRDVRQVRTPGGGVAFAPDGKALASAGRDGALRLLDPATGNELRRFEPRPGAKGRQAAFAGVLFAPDGRAVLTVGADAALALWDVATGRFLRPLGDPAEGTRGAAATAAFAPDGRSVAVCGKDFSVRLLEAATGRERCRFQGHRAEVTALAFSADGRTLATASQDTTALLWDVTGKGGAKAELADADLKALWADLAGGDAAKAYRAMNALAAAPRQALPFLKAQLKPASPAEARRVPQLIKDLDSEDFVTRKRAAEELEKLGDLARNALLEVLAGKPSLEVRKRAEAILNNLEGNLLTGEPLREVRAVEVLEQVGTPEARAALERLAEGAPEARLTVEAKASLARLARRAASRP